jgi:stage II sporulation protein D
MLGGKSVKGRFKRIIINKISALLVVAVFIFIIIIAVLFCTRNNQNEGNSNSISQFLIKPNNIIFNQNNGGGPNIKVLITKENKIETMSLEEYIRGVVAAEMPAEYNIEALKAQAVAARTYAAAHMKIFGGQQYNPNLNADVSDTVDCQVYMNKQDRLKAWPQKSSGVYWNKITQAVQATSGEILVYDGDIVKEPFYLAVSSGKTENSEEVFSSAEPYLKSVESPGETNALKYKTTLNISNKDMVYKLNSAIPSSGILLSKLRNQINIKSRSSAGTVQQIKVGSITISGQQFRRILGLNSANFTIKSNEKSTSIICLGYGHDVGMSQWGANIMGKSGKKYNQILLHYYSGVGLEKLDYSN